MKYITIKVNLMKGQEIAQSILELKHRFSFREYQECFTILLKNYKLKKLIGSYLKIDSFSLLVKEGLFPMLYTKGMEVDMKTQAKEFEFWVANMETHIDEIRKFEDLRQAFELALLRGDVRYAENALSIVESDFGKSFWYIEARLLLYAVNGNTSSFHEFYKTAKEQSVNEISATYIRMIRRKVELNESNSEYNEFCQTKLKHLYEKEPFNQEVLVYIEYMLLYNIEDLFSQDNGILKNLLIACQYLSLIDQYILFQKMDVDLRAQLYVCCQNIRTFQDEGLLSVLEAADDLKSKIGLFVFPVRPSQMEWKSDQAVAFIKDNANLILEGEIKELFQKGEYAECICRCKDLLKKNIQFDIMKLLSAAYVASNQDLKKLPDCTMLDKIIKNMCQMYVKTNDLSNIEIYQTLSRIFMICNFGQELLGFIHEQLYAVTESGEIKYLCVALFSKNELSVEHSLLLGDTERDEFIDSWQKALGKCILCNWAYGVRHIFAKYGCIAWDEVSKRLLSFRWDENMIQKVTLEKLIEVKDNVSILLREEYGIYIFNQAVKEKQYGIAFKIYACIFFASPFQVIRMNIKDLNKRLHLGICNQFYGNLEFAVYACNVELHYPKPKVTSECVKNCFRKILNLHHVDRPSLIELPGDYLESWEMAYFLFYICDLKMLNVNNLYGMDAIVERRNILRKVRGKYNCDNELKVLSEEEIKLSISDDSIQMKTICASWIKIPQETYYIANVFRKMTEENLQYVQRYNAFRDLVIKCKDPYIEAINEKLGTTIRHCILQSIMIQNFEKYGVYLRKDSDFNFAEDQELNTLKKYNFQNYKQMFRIISKFFDNFFFCIEDVRKRIYFSSHSDNEKIRFYVTEELIAQGVQKLSGMKTPEDLNHLIMEVLHKTLEAKMNELGESVINQIKTGYDKEIDQLKIGLEDFLKTEEYLRKLDSAIEEAIKEVQLHFGVNYNENRKYLLSSFIKMLEKQFLYMVITNECNEDMEIRHGVMLIMDIILMNCIENVEKHAKIPLHNTKLETIIRSKNDGVIEMLVKNRISAQINKQELERTIGEINQGIQDESYTNIRTEDDEHGLGYYRIANFLYSNFKEPWKLKLSLDSDVFNVYVSLGLEENNENIDC